MNSAAAVLGEICCEEGLIFGTLLCKTPIFTFTYKDGGFFVLLSRTNLLKMAISFLHCAAMTKSLFFNKIPLF